MSSKQVINVTVICDVCGRTQLDEQVEGRVDLHALLHKHGWSVRSHGAQCTESYVCPACLGIHSKVVALGEVVP